MKHKNTIKNFLKNTIPENKINLLNRSFEIVGDIAITEINQELIEFEKEIGEGIMKINSSIKTVLKKSGIHEGEFRTQKLIHIAGEDKKETIYQENGIKLKTNPETVYFSARLSVERQELMNKLKKNSKILIMFSGIGPYSFIALKKQPNISNITSIELNPEGHKYALENLKLNKNLLKKSKYYKNLIQFLKENKIPIFEKKIISNLNELKINFINGDVKKKIKNFKLKQIKEFNKNFLDYNEILKENNSNYNKIYNFLKNKIENSNKEIIIRFNNLNEIEKINLSYFIVLFQEKLIFETKINGEIYLFDNKINKIFLLNHLTNNTNIKDEIYFDEIFMPLPKDAELFLDDAFKVSKKGTIIHMYDFVLENEFPKKTEEAIKKYAEKNNKIVEIISTRKVGQYAPGKYRVCCDFKLI